MAPADFCLSYGYSICMYIYMYERSTLTKILAVVYWRNETISDICFYCTSTIAVILPQRPIFLLSNRPQPQCPTCSCLMYQVIFIRRRPSRQTLYNMILLLLSSWTTNDRQIITPESSVGP